MVVFANRAAAILYSYLVSLEGDAPFLLPANVCGVVPLVFRKARRRFEFVDVSPADHAVDRAQVLERLTSRPGACRGLLFVRPYGRLAPEEGFFREVKARCPDCLVIDDRCLAIPDFTATPGLADLLLFSTGRTKYAGMPLGGFGVVRDGARYSPQHLGFSADRLEEMRESLHQCVAARRPFVYQDSEWLDTGSPDLSFDGFRRLVESRLAEVAPHKAALNAIYSANLPPQIQFPADYQRWRFNILVPGKESLLSKMFAAGLFASSHYAPLAGVFEPGSAPVAAALHARVVNLFNDGHFTAEMALRATDVVNRHLEGG